MQFRRYIAFVGFSLIMVFLVTPCFAQLGFSYQFAKPKEYEDRVLPSEKSDQKKFTLSRRFVQNTVTHYNYYFNANNKLNEIIERAKLSFRDDYSQLLPFYNYTLDATAADSIQLDSLSYKAQTGIAIHDLRGDWIDNLYLLWGASYYFQKKFDSAYLMFQFINYAFAPKEKDGYYRTIGSRMDGNEAYSVSTKEKKSLVKKVFSEPPSRNDAFIWQVRNHLAREEYAEAGSLIVTLRNDPAFPKRLYSDLEEVQALFFYKRSNWDSAAAHLVEALDNASGKQERARWEYLAGQLYELSRDYAAAEKYYGRAISHATDPVLDIYARLASIRVNKDGGDDYIAKNIASLVKMAKRDKYQDYRDIIYYTAAQMELERNNTDGALALLEKSVKYSANDRGLRNKAFLQLAELSFRKRAYRQAYNFYDSLNLTDPSIADPESITRRKMVLGRLAGDIEIIERQDSLQRIADLPEQERKELVKKLARQLRRQQGLKEEGVMTTGSLSPQNIPSLFSNNDNKGEWYFYNPSLRQKGEADFKSRWGTRPNNDNWRRSAALSGQVRKGNIITPPGVSVAVEDQASNIPAEITADVLYDRLPLTPEKLKQSNDSIQAAMFDLGKLYIQEIEDCPAGIATYEELQKRFPQHPQMDEVLFNLYYCHKKNGNLAQAEAIKNEMNHRFPGHSLTTIINTGRNPLDKHNNPEATKAYEDIYDLFIEGSFAEAIARKRAADSLYGNSYWTPQLLYIESVYYIRQREDSVAKTVLNNIISRFDRTAMAEKARTMLDVLNRRQQIEEELRNLVIERPAGDTARTTYPVAVTTIPATTKKDSLAVRQPPVKDTIVKTPTVTPPLPKDTVVTTVKTPVIKDTISRQPVAPVPPPNTFVYTPDMPHYVLLILNKVDPVFVNEARNAFARHNKDNYFNKTMTAELVTLDNDNRLLLISPFRNAQEAIDYIDKTRPKAASEIIPWLKGGKYTFSIISQANFDLLQANKELDKYTQFLQQQVPGKF